VQTLPQSGPWLSLSGKQAESTIFQALDYRDKRFMRTLPIRSHGMPCEVAQRGKLLVERGNRLGIGQRVAAANSAAFKSGGEGRTEDNIMERRSQGPEGRQEPWADNSVHDDEMASEGIYFGGLCQHVDDDPVLLMRIRQIWGNGAVLDEVPEIVGVKMDL
jgi:hypothetical protein